MGKIEYRILSWYHTYIKCLTTYIRYIEKTYKQTYFANIHLKKTLKKKPLTIMIQLKNDLYIRIRFILSYLNSNGLLLLRI